MNNNPVIIIPGIGQSKLVLCDDNGNKIKNVWPFEIDTKAILNELKGSLMKLMLFKKDAGFSDRIAEIVSDIAEPLAVNPDGTKKHNVRPVEFRKPLSEFTAEEKAFVYKTAPLDMFGEKISEDRIFFFAYDFLGDIADIASSLDSFVEFVKESAKSEKVDFLVIGTAGSVLKAYIKDYGVKSHCAKIVCAAAALDGMSLVADFYENNLRIEDPISLLSALGGKIATVSSMAGMLPGDVLNNIITKSLDVIRTLITDNCTALYALVPADRTDAVISCVGMDDKLLAKVKEYSDYSRSFASVISGYDYYLLGGCGKKLPPVASDENADSDGLVDTASATLGLSSGNVMLFDGQSHDSVLYNDAAMSFVLKFLCGEDVSDYPAKNGSRSVKKLKNVIIPKLVADGSSEAEECINEYKNLIGAVVIENDTAIKNLESKSESIISSGNA